VRGETIIPAAENLHISGLVHRRSAASFPPDILLNR